MIRRSFAFALSLLAASALAPGIAWAQADDDGELPGESTQVVTTPSPDASAIWRDAEWLAVAEQRYAEADFEGALRAIERAEQHASSRVDVVRGYALRALIHYALGEEAEMRDALAVVALLAPTHELGPGAPPAVRQAWEDVRNVSQKPLRLELHVDPRPHGVRIRAKSFGNAGGVVRAVRVAGRVNQGPWLRGDDQAIELPAGQGDVVEYYAAVLGPGGSRLVERGTRRAPLRWQLAPLRGDNTLLWGAAGVAVGVVGALFVFWLVERGGGHSTTLSEPQIRW